MKTREQYIQTLKDRLDAWNADVARWETQAASARADMHTRYAKQLEEVRKHREEARYQLRLLQGASSDAWKELARGADEAWDRMQAAVTQARTHFEKSTVK